MRSFATAAAATLVLLSVSACDAQPPQPPAPRVVTPVAAIGQVPAVKGPMAAWSNEQACVVATRAAAGVSALYRDRIDVIEKAVAKGDTATVVRAADTINHTFTDTARLMSLIAKQPVAAPIKQVATRSASTLTEVSSATYTGSITEIGRRLSDQATSVSSVCRRSLRS